MEERIRRGLAEASSADPPRRPQYRLFSSEIYGQGVKNNTLKWDHTPLNSSVFLSLCKSVPHSIVSRPQPKESIELNCSRQLIVNG